MTVTNTLRSPSSSFFLLYCFMAPHCQACRHMYFHVIFWRCQKDDRGKGRGGREGHEQEAMPVHLCQSLMETAVVNSYVNIHRAAGPSALQHKNYTYSARIGSRVSCKSVSIHHLRYNKCTGISLAGAFAEPYCKGFRRFWRLQFFY